MELIFEQLKSAFPQIKENVSLKEYSSYRIGGSADYFFETGNTEELEKIVNFCKSNKIRFFLLGGGSNVLISDEPFKGLAIVYKKKFGEYDFNINHDSDIVRIEVEASVLLAEAILKISNAGLSGFEWGAGIPGTIGGAINGNAGAFNGCISDNIVEIEVLNIFGDEAKRLVLKKENCRFSYRNSIFKETQYYIILKASFILKKLEKELILEKIDNILKKRAGKHPKGFSAGSVFKNYQGSVNKKYFKKYPELEKYSENGIIPTGYLIEKCNLKGIKIGDAQIDPEHANFIINLGNAKAENIVKLINLCKKEIKERFNIDIQEEIKYIGEF